MPNENTKPFIGEAGKVENVEEDRIEMVCDENKIEDIIASMKQAHPYEEVSYDVHQLEDF